MEDLIEKVIEWGGDRGIFNKGTVEKQVLKTQEEVGELVFAVGQGNMDGVKDGIGDVTVTLVLLSEMFGLTLEECLQYAYNEIKGRTGEMKNGTFVKEA